MTRILAMTALALASLSAQAEAEYSGHLGINPEPYVGIHGFLDVPAGTALDLAYLFELQGNHTAFAQGIVYDPGQGFDATGAMLSLWRSNGDLNFANDTLIGGFDFGTETMSMQFDGLSDGEYYWRVEAVVAGSEGTVTFEAALTPAVPEPGSAALLAAGLMTLAASVRRRAKNAASEH